MTDPTALIVTALAALAAVAVVAVAGLKGWRDWIGLQQASLARPAAAEPGTPTAGARIELADLKERIRKLEAIAAGVDL